MTQGLTGCAAACHYCESGILKKIASFEAKHGRKPKALFVNYNTVQLLCSGNSRLIKNHRLSSVSGVPTYIFYDGAGFTRVFVAEEVSP